MIVFDTVKFAKDANAHHKRRKQTQSASAQEIGISPSAFSGILLARMPSIDAAASIAHWMKKDINNYFKEGLPHGLTARWTGAHEDGRIAVITLGKESAQVIERLPNGRVVNKQTANYGNGGAARYFTEFCERYIGLDFTETEHLTA
jgi:transcriptional regulator with XRE-family HTH domain